MALARWHVSPGLGRRRSGMETAAQFRKCENPGCGATLFVKDIERNAWCCKQCSHHFRIGSRTRIEITADPGSWEELFEGLTPVDALQFKGKRTYLESLQRDRQKTGLRDAVICGTARIGGLPLVLVAMEFQFIGGSMGSVVGEKVTRAIEHGTAHRLPVVIICCSGGARMQEGALSLMQMAKTSAAVERHNQAGLPYFTVLTDPTLAGVSASFAFLADLIIAEPKAMIGFTGARVIEQTIRKKLPDGFQEAEFLLKHGQVDMVVSRPALRATLAQLLSYACGRPCVVLDQMGAVPEVAASEDASAAPVPKTTPAKPAGQSAGSDTRKRGEGKGKAGKAKRRAKKD